MYRSAGRLIWYVDSPCTVLDLVRGTMAAINFNIIAFIKKKCKQKSKEKVKPITYQLLSYDRKQNFTKQV